MSVWLPCDDFTGPWKVVEVSGKEPPSAESQFYFWGHDGTGDLNLGTISANLDCDYDETLEGLPAVSFKVSGHDGEKRVRGSGIAAILRDGTLQGSIKIGRRASGFVARRDD